VKPYYSEPGIDIYLGDCREILPSLPKVDLVLTDPPYGMNWKSQPFKGKDGTFGKSYPMIHGDDGPFDPTPWLLYPKVCLWGYNHFAERLPKGTVLVWLKNSDDSFGTFLSDAELAWVKGGHGVWCKRDFSMKGITTTRQHPNQKPVKLMEWALQFMDAKENETVLDPFMGSGTTLRAAKDLGRKAIGIEIEEKYCEIAVRRLRQEVMKL
jgi:site-specific DNA-methyltransferase (adenine-specific)